jgi:membrane protease YdiL (CAAX protease family)
MQYKSVKGYTGVGQLGIFFLFIGVGLVLTAVIQLVIGMYTVPDGTSITHLGDAMVNALKDPKNIMLSRLLQVLGTFSMFFIPAVLYAWVCHGRNGFWLGFNKYINIYQVLIGFLIIFTANIMASPMEELVKAVVVHFPSVDALAKKLELAYNEQVMIMSNLTSWSEFFMALLIIAFFPALFEEVFFRGALQNLLVKWWKMPILAIVVTSLLFSFIHMSVYLFLSRAVLGFVLGLLYYKTKNIWVNIIAHFLNNAIAVAQLFSMSRSKEKMDISKLDPKLDWWYGLIAVAILFLLFKVISRYSQKNIMKIYTKEQVLMANENTGNPFANSN